MPGGDRTGPLGAGPRTGRGAGFCRGSARPGWAGPSSWQGALGGRGRGGVGPGAGGHGWRHRFFATGIPGWAWAERLDDRPAAGAEREWLARRAEQLEGELQTVRARLADLGEVDAGRDREGGGTP